MFLAELDFYSVILLATKRKMCFSLNCGAKLIGYFEINNNFAEKNAKNE